VFVLSVTVNK